VIPVDQTTHGPTTGNCFSACVASILELPISEVPFFMAPEQWWPPFVEWCAMRGYDAVYFPNTEYVPLGYSIVGGPSYRWPGKLHACVALDGVVVHDPHPSKLGLPEVQDFIVLEKRA
jgi:hypothetical protein